MLVVRSPSGYREERKTLQISILQETPGYGSGSVSNLRIDATSRDRMEQAPDHGAGLVEQPERLPGPAAVNCSGTGEPPRWQLRAAAVNCRCRRVLPLTTAAVNCR